MTKAKELMERKTELNKEFSKVNEEIYLSINHQSQVEVLSSDSIRITVHAPGTAYSIINKHDALKLANWIYKMFGNE